MSPPEPNATLALEATVSPSEDPEKVLQAVKNIVGEAQFNTNAGPHSVRLVTEDPRALVHIRDQLRDRHVRSAARRQMLQKSSGRSTNLMLNRQAAAAGVIALCGSPEESPLGPIYLILESENIGAAVDYLAAISG
jgi:predicted RNA binding protein with dsRBD fold (UPF0201 family)